MARSYPPLERRSHSKFLRIESLPELATSPQSTPPEHDLSIGEYQVQGTEMTALSGHYPIPAPPLRHPIREAMLGNRSLEHGCL